MADTCENLSPSSRERQTVTQSLLCSQQNVYNDLDKRYRDPKTTDAEKIIIIKQMGEVADMIIKLGGG